MAMQVIFQLKVPLKLVDELLVYCTNLPSGCRYTCERQFLQGHINRTCPYSYIRCPKDACSHLILRRDEPEHDCKAVTAPIPRSPESDASLKNDLDFSSGEVSTSSSPDGSLESQSTHGRLDHVHSCCPESDVSCEQAGNGCAWVGTRKNLGDHLMGCPYHAIGGFFEIEKRRHDALVSENDLVRVQHERLQSAQNFIYRELALIRAAIGPWLLSLPQVESASHHHPPVDHQPDQVTLGDIARPPDPIAQSTDTGNMRLGDFGLGMPYSPSQAHESIVRPHNPESSAVFRPAVPPPLDPGRSIYENFCDVHNSVTALSSNLASLARLQNQSLNAETLRLSDELASLRVILHGIRLQVNSILMERNLQFANGNENVRLLLNPSDYGQHSPRTYSSHPGTKL